MKGFTVVVLDVEDAKAQDDSVEYYKCDIGNPAQVRAVCERVVEEVGVPTVLINNAAVISGKPILDLSDNDINR